MRYMRDISGKKTAKMRLIEEKFGRPVEAVLRDLYRTMTMKQITDYLRGYGIGVSVGTLSVWFLKLGIGTRRWAHPEEVRRAESDDNPRSQLG